jgi:DNA polymerase III delta subunit
MTRLVLIVGEDRGLAAHRLERLSGGRPVRRRATLPEAVLAARTPDWSGEAGVVAAWEPPLDEAAAEAAEGLRPDGLLHTLAVYLPHPDRRLRAWRALEAKGERLVAEPSPAAVAAAILERAEATGIDIPPALVKAAVPAKAHFLDVWHHIERAWLYAYPRPVDGAALAATRAADADVSVFAWLDAVAERRLGPALAGLEAVAGAGEGVRLAHLLARQWRNLAAVAAGEPPPGLPPFVRERLARAARRWRAEEIRAGFRVLLALDRRLKSGREPRAALAVAVARLVEGKGELGWEDPAQFA